MFVENQTDCNQKYVLGGTAVKENLITFNSSNDDDVNNDNNKDGGRGKTLTMMMIDHDYLF